MSLRVQRSLTKQSQGLRLLRTANNDGKYFCSLTYVLFSIKSERRDLNPRPPLPQSGALPSCATPRKSDIENGILNFYY